MAKTIVRLDRATVSYIGYHRAPIYCRAALYIGLSNREIHHTVIEDENEEEMAAVIQIAKSLGYVDSDFSVEVLD